MFNISAEKKHNFKFRHWNRYRQWTPMRTFAITKQNHGLVVLISMPMPKFLSQLLKYLIRTVAEKFFFVTLTEWRLWAVSDFSISQSYFQVSRILHPASNSSCITCLKMEMTKFAFFSMVLIMWLTNSLLLKKNFRIIRQHVRVYSFICWLTWLLFLLTDNLKSSKDKNRFMYIRLNVSLVSLLCNISTTCIN